MQTFEIKRGATWPSLGATIGLDRNGNLTDCTVQFRMSQQDGTVVIDASATIISEVLGTVEYVWQAGNTETPGNFWAEFWTSLPTGEVVKLPVDEFINIVIVDDLS